MSGLVNVVLVVALVALAVVRQFSTRRVPEGARWLVLPVVAVLLVARGVGGGASGIVDPHHPVAAATLLATQLFVGMGMGVAWGMTTRLWQDENGAVWARNTRVAFAIWTGGIILRVGLALLGAAMGIHEGVGAIVLALGVALAVRGGVVAWRAGALRSRGAGRTVAGIRGV